MINQGCQVSAKFRAQRKNTKTKVKPQILEKSLQCAQISDVLISDVILFTAYPHFPFPNLCRISIKNYLVYNRHTVCTLLDFNPIILEKAQSGNLLNCSVCCSLPEYGKHTSQKYMDNPMFFPTLYLVSREVKTDIIPSSNLQLQPPR